MIEKHAAFRMITVITTPKLADKATKVLADEGVPVEYRLAATGTAPNEVMDVLGLGSVDKTILISMIPKSFSKDILVKLHDEMKIKSANSGIAFVISLTGMNNRMIRMLTDLDSESDRQEQRKEGSIMSDTKYSVIAAIINRGYSNELMDAAREAGASGGSVINSRRIAAEAVCNKWGLGGQEEKEIVLIVACNDNKVEIMKKITEKCGVNSEANGMVISVPIEDVIGLEKE